MKPLTPSQERALRILRRADGTRQRQVRCSNINRSRGLRDQWSVAAGSAWNLRDRGLATVFQSGDYHYAVITDAGLEHLADLDTRRARSRVPGAR